MDSSKFRRGLRSAELSVHVMAERQLRFEDITEILDHVLRLVMLKVLVLY